MQNCKLNQFLPELISTRARVNNKPASEEHDLKSNNGSSSSNTSSNNSSRSMKRHSRASVQTQTISKASSASSPASSLIQDTCRQQASSIHQSELKENLPISSSGTSGGGQPLDSCLPPLVVLPNSALVHRHATTTAGDQLALASCTTAASLPLMIGNRSKCVVNLVGASEERDQNQLTCAMSQQQHQQHQQQASVPQNTALRAEQRRQNMSVVSIVRPVINTNVVQTASNNQYESFGQQKQQQPQQHHHNNHYNHHQSTASGTLIDDWMLFDKSINSHLSSSRGPQDASSVLDELILNSKLNGICLASGGTEYPVSSMAQEYLRSEQVIKQQMLMLRREEHELNRGILRQHQFVLNKIEQRKRHLQIIQSVWVQRDFKHAIEKMVDIYHQGLIFTQESACNSANVNKLSTCKNSTKTSAGGRDGTSNNTMDQFRQSKLKSLNTSLVVDVISIIILRPKLWSLEICQLLLPIINQDLLVQTSYEPDYYVEIGLKATKLILTQFSPIIKSTLDSLNESNKLVGIDLSREDRINRSLSCYKSLLETQSILTKLNNSNSNSTRDTAAYGQACKLAPLQRELQTMLMTLTSSISVNACQLARRFHNDN